MREKMLQTSLLTRRNSPGGRAQSSWRSWPFHSGWSAQGAWEYCKETYTYGAFLLPGSNPADFEISWTNKYMTLGSVRGNINDTVCAAWQNVTSQNAMCYQVDVRMAISGNSNDSQDYSSMSDATLKFTINLRRKSNPSETWSVPFFYSATFE